MKCNNLRRVTILTRRAPCGVLQNKSNEIIYTTARLAASCVVLWLMHWDALRGFPLFCYFPIHQITRLLRARNDQRAQRAGGGVPLPPVYIRAAFGTGARLNATPFGGVGSPLPRRTAALPIPPAHGGAIISERAPVGGGCAGGGRDSPRNGTPCARGNYRRLNCRLVAHYGYQFQQGKDGRR